MPPCSWMIFAAIAVDGAGAYLAQRQLTDALAAAANDAVTAGLDNAEPRTPQSTTPTTFRQWCQDVLKPAVLS